MEADDIKGQVIAALLADSGIGAIVETRVYPSYIPEGVNQQPVLRVTKVADAPYDIMTGASGSTTATIQIDVFGPLSEGVAYLAKLVRLLLTGAAGGMLGAATIGSVAKTDDFDQDDNPIDKSDRWRFRRVLRFDIDYCEDTVA